MTNIYLRAFSVILKNKENILLNIVFIKNVINDTKSILKILQII